METHAFSLEEMANLMSKHQVKRNIPHEQIWRDFKVWFNEFTGCDVAYDFDLGGRRKFVVTAPCMMQFKLTYL